MKLWSHEGLVAAGKQNPVASGLHWHLELGLLERHGPHSFRCLPLLTAQQVGVILKIFANWEVKGLFLRCMDPVWQPWGKGQALKPGSQEAHSANSIRVSPPSERAGAKASGKQPYLA